MLLIFQKTIKELLMKLRKNELDQRQGTTNLIKLIKHHLYIPNLNNLANINQYQIVSRLILAINKYLHKKLGLMLKANF